MEVRRVERVDVGAEASTDPRRKGPPVRDRRDGLQEWPDRVEPLGLDRPLVLVAGIVVADLAFR
jgi:hypothetical protein